MAIKIESGLWTTIWRAKKASTAFPKDSLVCLIAGFTTPAPSTAGAADSPVLGVYTGAAITAATVGTYLYSNTAKIPVTVPIGPATINCLCTGTLASNEEGSSFDMTDDVTVNANSTTYGAVTCVRFISATQGIFAISKSIYANVA